MTVNGAMDARLPGNLNVSFDGVDGEALLVSLDDIAVSSGAACTQAEPSHVLDGARARRSERALASLRFGIGRGTTKDEIDQAAAKVGEVVGCGSCRQCSSGAGLEVEVFRRSAEARPGLAARRVA